MRQKFEFDGDGVDLILSHQNGDLLRCPLASLLSMATLNDGEFARFTHEVPPADPFNPDARPTRRHVRIMVEETPVPEQVDTLALVEVEPGTVRIITDPAAVTGPTARLITDREDGVVSIHHRPGPPAPLERYTPASNGGCEGHYDDDATLTSGAGIGEVTYCNGACAPVREGADQ